MTPRNLTNPGNTFNDMAPEHPFEPLLIAVGVCANHPNPEWWTTSDSMMETVHWREKGTARVEKRSAGWRAARACQGCAVLPECRVVTEYLEEAGPGRGRQRGYIGGVRAGESADQRATRRRARDRSEA